LPVSQGPTAIGAPLPTPPEATTPPTYETPGLEADPGTHPAARKADQGLTDLPDGASGAAFSPSATLYGLGSPNAPGAVVLQARETATIVARGPGGTVYFAAVLKPGEAWRAPDMEGLTVDVGSAGAVEVFVGGVSRGRLRQPQAVLSRLVGP
jgi:hypothetical protein